MNVVLEFHSPKLLVVYIALWAIIFEQQGTVRSPPNGAKMILNTTRSNAPHVCIIGVLLSPIFQSFSLYGQTTDVCAMAVPVKQS